MEDNKRKYYSILLKQYFDSLGIKKDDFDIDDFYHYIDNLSKQTNNYKEFLRSYDIDQRRKVLMEINKGPHTGIMEENGLILTPYYNVLGINGEIYGKDKRLVEEFDDDGYKILYEKDSITKSNYLLEDDIEYGLIHNITQDDLNKLFTYKIQDICNFCVGAYGNLSDKDARRKLLELRKIQEEYPCSEMYYDTLADQYYACVKTEDYQKVKVKTR